MFSRLRICPRQAPADTLKGAMSKNSLTRGRPTKGYSLGIQALFFHSKNINLGWGLWKCPLSMKEGGRRPRPDISNPPEPQWRPEEVYVLGGRSGGRGGGEKASALGCWALRHVSRRFRPFLVLRSSSDEEPPLRSIRAMEMRRSLPIYRSP